MIKQNDWKISLLRTIYDLRKKKYVTDFNGFILLFIFDILSCVEEYMRTSPIYLVIKRHLETSSFNSMDSLNHMLRELVFNVRVLIV